MTQLNPLAGVQIGVREIYDLLLATDRKVDQMRGEVSQVAQAHGELATDLTDHEARIRALERGRWPLPSNAPRAWPWTGSSARPRGAPPGSDHPLSVAAVRRS
ncbi:hypothetical protein [Streptosporangium canum]|uniref:hypothetical protein n=1 Tax=Streptosporangium canum TaxID=324952 RepID=UPI003F4B84BE